MWHRPTCGKGQTQAHTSKKLLALLNHSFWGVHFAGRNWSFTCWGVHIAGGNWAFTSAVEKLSWNCPATEYQHKQGHTSNISCRIQKNYRHQRCVKIWQDITLQQGERRRPQMAQQTLGNIISTSNCLHAISHDHSFNRKLSKKLSNDLALRRLSCSNCWGRSVRPSGMYWQSSDLSRSFGTSPISQTLSLYMECNLHSVVICKVIVSKQHTSLMRPFQRNHVRTSECIWHGQNGAGLGRDGTSTGDGSRDREWNQPCPGDTKQERLSHACVNEKPCMQSGVRGRG
jgi:hypothetical protein